MAKFLTRLEQLRQLMKDRKFDAFIVHHADPHVSEYLPTHYLLRPFISGFTGSWGHAVITQEKALLWTDSRYWVQAGKQLPSPEWAIMKDRLPETPSIDKWINENLESGVVGIDPWLLTADQQRTLATTFNDNKRKDIKLQSCENLVDLVWAQDKEDTRPPLPTSPVFIQSVKNCGQTVQEKLERVAAELKKASANRILFTTLDDIAWLLNLRGSDVAYNPVFLSYVIVDDQAKATLFIHDGKLDAEAQKQLGEAAVEIKPYNAVEAVLKEEPENPMTYIVDSGRCNYALYSALSSTPKVFIISQSPSCVQNFKSQKNKVELEGMKDCHIRDAAALIKYFAWLEEQVESGVEVNEITGAAKLDSLRGEVPGFVSLSFDTISAVGENAACPHYTPSMNTKPITANEIYLVDSGGQYRDGTTDITRTVHMGTPTAKEIEAYTRVLKGHIGLANMIFPSSVKGFTLDMIARKSLWEVGLDYGHGTGHGVGSFLNVHEGPQRIGIEPHGGPLKEGMVTSNEPGYYEEGAFGIRIENIIVCVQANTPYQKPAKPFLAFETISLVPLAKKLIDPALLTDGEKAWVTSYHKLCLEKVAPLLQDNEKALAWLKREAISL